MGNVNWSLMVLGCSVQVNFVFCGFTHWLPLQIRSSQKVSLLFSFSYMNENKFIYVVFMCAARILLQYFSEASHLDLPRGNLQASPVYIRFSRVAIGKRSRV